MESTPPIAIGVDAAPAGWAVASLHADALTRADATTWQTRLHLVADVDDLMALRGDADGLKPPVAIDIPIGLPESVRYRRCDEQARELLGGRSGSVFPPPARYMLQAAGDYPTIRMLVAADKERNPAARGYSAQAAGIATKVREVDAWVRAHPESEDWLFECHPELSFYALNEGAALPSKHSVAGMMQRLQRVRELFPDTETQLTGAPWSGKQATPADFLDAYGALSTALVCARGEQEELGDGERDAQVVLMRMAM